MKVGFIGLGIMGASMASNLMKGGFEAVVHDIRREAAAPHLAAGATWADTPRKVAEATEVVLQFGPVPHLPFAAVPDSKMMLMPRTPTSWDMAGVFAAEALGRGFPDPFTLWAWRNPRPDVGIRG